MTQNEFGDDIYEFVYNSNHPRKKITSEKNGFTPYPQVFRNVFNNIQKKSWILSRTKTNYMRRPSVEPDYTNSFDVA